jgi:hypothetical protein
VTRKDDFMKRELCVAVLGLMMSPGHAWQQANQGNKDATGRAELPEQAGAPQASPAATPSPEIPLATPASMPPLGDRNPGEPASIDSALQTEIQDALNKDVTLSSSGLKVAVLADGIELSGDVASGRDRQNAGRIAQSYARGRKVVNHIVVKGHSATPASAPPQSLPGSLSSSAADPASSKSHPH